MPKLERVTARPVSPRRAGPADFGPSTAGGAWAQALDEVSAVATEIGVRVQRQRSASRLAEFRRAVYEKAFELKTRPEYEDDEAQFDLFLQEEFQNTPEGLLPQYQDAFRLEAKAISDRVRLQVKAESWGKAIDAGRAALGRTIDETVVAGSLAGELGRREAMDAAYTEIGLARTRGFLSAEEAEAWREQLRDQTYDALAGRLILEDPDALSDALEDENGEFRRNMDGERVQQWRRAVDRELDAKDGEDQAKIRWAAWRANQAAKAAREQATNEGMTLATDPEQGITPEWFDANKHKLSPTDRRTFKAWMENSGGYAPEMRPDTDYYRELQDQAELFPAEFAERELEAGRLRGELAPMRELQDEKRRGVKAPVGGFESILKKKIATISYLKDDDASYEYEQSARKWVEEFVADKKRHPNSQEIGRRLNELAVEFTDDDRWLFRDEAPLGAIRTGEKEAGEEMQFRGATPEQMEAVFDFMELEGIEVSDENAEKYLNIMTKKLSKRGHAFTAGNITLVVNELREQAKK